MISIKVIEHAFGLDHAGPAMRDIGHQLRKEGYSSIALDLFRLATRK